jgi:hypothetical protein
MERNFSQRSANIFMARRNPTLNRLQNLLLHQKNLKKMEYIRKQKAH